MYRIDAGLYVCTFAGLSAFRYYKASRLTHSVLAHISEASFFNMTVDASPPRPYDVLLGGGVTPKGH